MFQLPHYKEELISPLDKEEIERRLKIVVKHTNKQSLHHQKLEGPEVEVYLFNGLVSFSGFSISLVIEKPENFYPIINGHIETIEGGSKVMIEYGLFQSVKLFYFFSLALFTSLGFIAFYENGAWYWLGLVIIVQLVSFYIMQSRFREGVKKSRKELRRLLF